MQVIEAALAFAITMLTLSILCSALVETIHRVFGIREAGFRKMLGELFDQVLASYGEGVDARARFQRRMSTIRSPVGLTAKAPEQLPQGLLATVYDWIATLWRGRGLSELTVPGFMERLGSDAVGRRMVAMVREAAAAGAQEEVVNRKLKDVALKFEAFGNEASTYFERRARTLSVLVALIVAFALHVDAIDLFTQLMRDPNARAAVLATQDDVLRSNRRIEDQVDVAKKAAAPATVEELKKAFADAQANMEKTESKLRDLGVPIGWSTQRIEDARLNWLMGWIPIPCNMKLLIGLLLGGLLIGLGGPFWTDVIANVTRVRDAARTFIPEGAPAPAVPAPPPGAAAPVPPPVPQPRTPVDVFKVAHQ